MSLCLLTLARLSSVARQVTVELTLISHQRVRALRGERRFLLILS